SAIVSPHNPTTNARIDAGVLRSVRMILTLGGAVARGVMRLHHASRIDLVVFPEGRDDFPGQGPSCNLRGLLTQRPSCHG
ncbi:MAG: hypothetical protein IKE39_04400, partial [Cutibacterium sp.]|nr:hypothetical protein [Cutibacterium sp.]